MLPSLPHVAADFSETGCSTGLRVTPRHFGPDGKTVVLGVPFTHGVFLVGFHADKIARDKLAGCASHNNSPMGCQWCGMTGVWCNGSLRLMGYDEYVTGSTGKCHNEEMLMGVEDEKRWYTDAESTERQVVQAQANAR